MIIIGGRAHNIKQIHEVGRLKYPFAEISLEDPEEISKQIDELLELKEKYGIYYLAHFPNEGNPTDTTALKNEFVPKMKKLFDLSHLLGITKGTMHFWIDVGRAPQKLITQKIDLLSEMVAFANHKKLMLCIENLTERYESFSMALETIPDLRMTMDIGHGELIYEENTCFGFMQNLFHMIEHVHVHDNHGGTNVKDDLHLALGEGVVDYPQILSILKSRNYNSTITMEVLPSDMPKTKDEVEKYLS
ncbi:MAG: sugar phosphate isomerase/epimerase [Spirochaetota bacterium]|nr:sugar phosphate isomerase/epimerase [Spirochaetota bacterium]